MKTKNLIEFKSVKIYQYQTHSVAGDIRGY